jgi:hypothetical protein
VAVGDWEYSQSARRYRNTASGRFISAATVRQLRDDFVTSRKEAVADLADQLAAGDLTVQDWLRAMRAEVQAANLGEFVFGRGGVNAMAADDIDAVSRAVEGQFAYLQRFAEQLANGDLTAAQVAARAQLYAAAARQAFERGRAAAFGNPPLPTYPTVGSECRANCRCEWSIRETDTAWECTWVLDTSGTDNCETCRERAREYAPLVIAKEAA